MTKQEHLKTLIDEHEKEIVKAEFMADYYEQEEKNPTHVGKEEAKESKELWEKHIISRKNEVTRLKEYGKRKGII